MQTYHGVDTLLNIRVTATKLATPPSSTNVHVYASLANIIIG